MSLANVIDILPTDSFESAAARIALKPNAIILLLGNFDASTAPKVQSLCARALAPIALVANALIVDDGSCEGLAAQMGNAALQMDEAPAMLGILRSGVAALDLDHKYLFRLPAEWSDPAKSSFLIVAELAKDGAAVEKPVIAVLFGGSEDDKITVQRCARRGWPVFIAEGAGGLGDTILAALAPSADGTTAPEISDPDLREILDTGIISPLPLDGNVDDLKRMLLGPIQQSGDVLLAAWSQHDDLNLAALDRQKKFKNIQVAILSFGVLGTVLAVVSTGPGPAGRWLLHWFPSFVEQHYHQVLRALLILVPITTSVLTSFNGRFREGNKWILLRAAAESIKREIFRYRTRSGEYAGALCGQTSAQLKLAANVKNITANLAQTEVNRSNLPHQSVDDAMRTKFLRPEDYLVERIEDQISYFVRKTAALYRRLKSLQLWSLLVGGTGTFLAAVHFEVWVAVTTAVATAFITKLELDQVENSLVQYNVALTSLRNTEFWWKALSPWEKTRPKNIDLLVDQTEKALQLESAGWVQQMQSELDKLTEKQSDASHGSASAK